MPRLPLDNHRRKPPRRAFLRGLCPYFISFVVLSFGLGCYGILSARFPSPKSQRLGWQAWDTVRYEKNNNDPGSHVAVSLPLDLWDPMAAHTTGLTEIAIKWCLISPKVTKLCWPKSTPDEDVAKGKWVMVDVDLNTLAGRWNLYMYYRRTRRFDVPLIDELRMWPEPPPKDADLDGWVQAPGDLREGERKSAGELRLWYKTKHQSNSSTTVITEVMPMFGDDDPFFGFERVQGGKIADAKDGKWDAVDLVYRRGNPVAPAAPSPKFHEDGTFKILQIADLHYSVGDGECKDTDKSPCTGDPETATWLAEALDAEKPDLVVFSGDQLNGQKTSYNAFSVFGKFAKPVIERKIPWAAVFGNHDSEIAHDRMEQMQALQRMPYSLARAGPLDVDGVGNYDVHVLSPDGLAPIFTLFFLDSGAYQPTIIPFTKPDYDYIHDTQVQWFLDAADAVRPIHRPYSPTRRGVRRDDQRQTLSKPNAMAWWHIPLKEAYNSADTTTQEGFDGVLDLGTMRDPEGSSKHESGMFAKAIKGAVESDDSRVSQVKVMSHGHCHLTDRCRRVQGVWACFNGGSSFSGYGAPDFDRRVRVYKLDEYGEKISTYKRTTGGEIVDNQVLVGDGAPPGWGVGV